MKTKIGILIAIGMLVAAPLAGITGVNHGSGSGTPSLSAEHTTQTIQMHFSAPACTDDGRYITVNAGTEFHVTTAGEPMLPYATETMAFPLGTDIEKVTVSVDGVETRRLEGTVAPAPKPVPLTGGDAQLIQEPGPVYDRDALYPSRWVQWHTGAGLQDGEQVTFLTMQAYPARYNPQSNELRCIDSVQVEVTYETPAEPLLTADRHDLLVIAPQAFTDALQPLVQHKEDHGLATKLVTLQEIYDGDYFDVEGRDNAEQVKYFIRDALEDWGIQYVMLVGDAGVFPTRYVVSKPIDGSFPSDLYYADLFHANGSFAGWNADGDDTFGERKDDDIDTYPDVAVGRLPADTAGDVQRMVTAIITHQEQSGIPTDAVFVGTELFWDSDLSEGDYLKEQIRREVPQLDVTRLYERDRYPRDGISSTKNVVEAIESGTTLLNFASHGSPGGMGWEAGGWSISDVERLQPPRTPVVFAMACSTNRFDTTDCLGEAFLLEGNAVGYVGSVRVAYVYTGEGITSGLSGALDMAFYRAYRDGCTRLGEIFTRAQTAYLADHPFSTVHDHLTLLEYNMLGDPTIRLPPLDGTSQAIVNQRYATDGAVTVHATAHGCSDSATIQLFYRRAASRWSSWHQYGEPRQQPWTWQVSLDDGPGRYEFYTVLHDGNYTEQRPAIADAACTLDMTPPDVTVAQPTGGLYLAGRQLVTTKANVVVALGPVDVTAAITDEVAGVDTVTFSLDGETYTADANAPYRTTLQGPLIGSHTITVSATDRAGNTASTSTSRWFIKPL